MPFWWGPSVIRKPINIYLWKQHYSAIFIIIQENIWTSTFDLYTIQRIIRRTIIFVQLRSPSHCKYDQSVCSNWWHQFYAGLQFILLRPLYNLRVWQRCTVEMFYLVGLRMIFYDIRPICPSANVEIGIPANLRVTPLTYKEMCNGRIYTDSLRRATKYSMHQSSVL